MHAAHVAELVHPDVVLGRQRFLRRDEDTSFRAGVKAQSPPFPNPRERLQMIWNLRNIADPAYLWLRHLLIRNASAPGMNFQSPRTFPLQRAMCFYT